MVDADAERLETPAPVDHPRRPTSSERVPQPQPRRVRRLARRRCSTATPASGCGTCTACGGRRRRGPLSPRARGARPYQVQARWSAQTCVGGSDLVTQGDLDGCRGRPGSHRLRQRRAALLRCARAPSCRPPAPGAVPVGAVRVDGVSVTVDWSAQGWGLAPVNATFSATCDPNLPPRRPRRAPPRGPDLHAASDTAEEPDDHHPGAGDLVRPDVRPDRRQRRARRPRQAPRRRARADRDAQRGARAARGRARAPARRRSPARMAQTVQGTNTRIQFTPDLLPGDITGVTVYDQKTRRRSSSTPGRSSPTSCSPTRSTARARRPSPRCSRSWRRAASRSTASRGRSACRSSCIATQNPIEQAGTYRLPEAQLDRFMMRTSLGYPDHAATVRILDGAAVADRRPRRPSSRPQALVGMADLAARRSTSTRSCSTTSRGSSTAPARPTRCAWA